MTSPAPVENPVTQENVWAAIEQLRSLHLIATLVEGLGEDNCIADKFDTTEWRDIGKIIRRLAEHPLTVLNELESQM